MKKILVAGGAGFIGSHLVDRLVEKGHDVIIIDDLSTGSKKNVNEKAELIVRDINDNLSDIFEKGIDYVFHLAAQVNLRKSLEEPMENARINIMGSLNLIENCIKHNVKKFIFSSTGGAIYSPEAKIPYKESSEVDPQSPYGVSKFTVENHLRIMKNVKNLDFAILRYSNVYGPRQNAKWGAGVVAIFANKVLNNEDLIVFGDGKQTRDFVYVDDVVNANLAALENDLHGIFNVSSGEEVVLKEMAEKIRELMNPNAGIVNKDAVEGELIRSCLSSDKLAEKGWKLSHGFDEGLKKTIDWFKR